MRLKKWPSSGEESWRFFGFGRRGGGAEAWRLGRMPLRRAGARGRRLCRPGAQRAAVEVGFWYRAGRRSDPAWAPGLRFAQAGTRCPLAGGRAAAGLLLLVDHLVQAAVLEHDALARLHAVSAAIEDAGDQNIGRIRAGVIHAGVALGPRRTLTSAAPGPLMRMRKSGVSRVSELLAVAKLISTAPWSMAISSPGTSPLGMLESTASLTVVKAQTSSVPR